MADRRFYLITALPVLGELGSVPPIQPPALLEHVGDTSRARALVATILLSDDLLQREAFLAREISDVSPAVLTDDQARNEEPLPSYLASPGEESIRGRALTDTVWAAYFRHAGQLAGRLHNEFLSAWVGFEVALRNGLATERARALGLEPDGYLVVPELADREANLDDVLSEWAATRHPLEGLQVLDRRRWSWLRDHDRWFSFSDDELAAYAARLMLLQRWYRLSRAGEEEAPAADGTPRQSDERTPL